MQRILRLNCSLQSCSQIHVTTHVPSWSLFPMDKYYVDTEGTNVQSYECQLANEWMIILFTCQLSRLIVSGLAVCHLKSELGYYIVSWRKCEALLDCSSGFARSKYLQDQPDSLPWIASLRPSICHKSVIHLGFIMVWINLIYCSWRSYKDELKERCLDVTVYTKLSVIV